MLRAQLSNGRASATISFIERGIRSVKMCTAAGANMDNFETHDERRIIPRTCFSIEPGVYLPDFGIRSEVNMYIGEHEAHVTGEVQTELLTL